MDIKHNDSALAQSADGNDRSVIYITASLCPSVSVCSGTGWQLVQSWQEVTMIL